MYCNAAKVANNDNKNDTLEASLGLDNLQFNCSKQFLDEGRRAQNLTRPHRESTTLATALLLCCHLPTVSAALPLLLLYSQMVTWGIIATCQAFTSNFAGIMKHEISTRVVRIPLLAPIHSLPFKSPPSPALHSNSKAVLFSFNSVAAAFSALLATALSQLNGRGGLKGWQRILILEGAPSIIVGVIAFVTLPNFPQNSKFFLSPREEEIAISRLPITATSVTDKKFDVGEFVQTVMDPLLILFYVILPSYGTSYFRPSIISWLGYTGNMANLMSAFPSILTAVFDQYWGRHSDKVKERPMRILFSLSMNLIGSALLLAGQIYLWAPGLRYFFMFIQAFAHSGLAIMYVYRANTVNGRKRLRQGSRSRWGILAGLVVAPFAYPNSWGPLYINAIWILVAMSIGAILCIFGIWAYEMRAHGPAVGERDGVRL
ncbi:hypothetical protein M427DRAFT_38608 [Gonapodya prolifera JEL478]|uniref:MFS general substrate transporter n=1 Tax=Gonapodya prolifera (strain JEL478) TaxID=1344416 RepID=A0A138ZYW3_GONPJ|nr:hypothetical protein M427DRAFT_38608 [Gonapodya prolifera JEL478]|eukprot:KXS09671.1 hypothetical protein M427DRAFT_38608 [Gonapodya prolifera JEL478]